MTDSVNLPAKLVLFGGGKKFLLISIIIPDLIGQFSIKSFFYIIGIGAISQKR